MTRILVLNGPNLGRLGSREPDVYGSANLDDLRAQLEQDAMGAARTHLRADGAAAEQSEPAEATVEVRQTNDESELISWIYEAVDTASPVILNPAAFTHYSYALRDACALLGKAGVPLIEVHISNPHARETFRHTSVISAVATGVIAGFGFESYRLALRYLLG